MKKYSLTFLLVFLGFHFVSAQQSNLSVEKIMQDTIWMGTFPSDIYWGAQSQNSYFDYNPEANPKYSLYRINIKNHDKILPNDWKETEKLLPQSGDFNYAETKKVYADD